MARKWLHFDPRRPPVVSVRIDSDRYRALVDTGAEVSFIGPELSLRLGLARVGDQAIVALAGGLEIVPAVQLPSIHFGDIDVGPCAAGVL